jgi:hypothetical protein
MTILMANSTLAIMVMASKANRLATERELRA